MSSAAPTEESSPVSSAAPAARPGMRFGSLVLALVGLAALVGAARLAAEGFSRGAPGGDGDVNPLASAGVVAGSDTAPQSAPSLAKALGTGRAKDTRGRVVPIVPAGQPTILMISSRTCSWCKRALRDLGEITKGRPLPRLTLLTLEGASDGAPMLDVAKLTGARLVGPASGSDEVLLTFRYPGTPTFVAIDRNGRVVRTLPGYPVRTELERWWAVMVGDAETP
ncbi:MAG: hypothetical protein LCH84_13385 [Gemmatimonadetes bacterium]|nr:hypothetical protein [Gemmatimonadota bacterium]